MTLVNFERQVLDHQERQASGEDGRLDPVAEPGPLPEPTLGELQSDLESSLRFLDYIDGQRAGNPSADNHRLADELERGTREKIAELRAEIAVRQATEGNEGDEGQT